MFRSIVLLVGGLASLATTSLLAQETVLGQEYGSGVHAYFAADYVRSYEQLTSAINGGSKDPRAFYFRGLAYLKLGRQPEAIADFRKGAEFESKDINRFYNVGKALERIQGPARIELENYRVQARMIALEEEARIRKARYEAIQREEGRVLREQAAAAPADAGRASPPASPPNADADPFATPEGQPAARPPKKAPAKPAEGGDEPKAEPAESEDPFATEPEKPAEKGNGGAKKAPATKKPAKEEPADEDPFASSEEKPADKKPADKKPAEKKPAEKKPADKKPAEKPESDDPFAS